MKRFIQSIGAGALAGFGSLAIVGAASASTPAVLPASVPAAIAADIPADAPTTPPGTVVVTPSYVVNSDGTITVTLNVTGANGYFYPFLPYPTATQPAGAVVTPNPLPSFSSGDTGTITFTVSMPNDATLPCPLSNGIVDVAYFTGGGSRETNYGPEGDTAVTYSIPTCPTTTTTTQPPPTTTTTAPPTTTTAPPPPAAPPVASPPPAAPAAAPVPAPPTVAPAPVSHALVAAPTASLPMTGANSAVTGAIGVGLVTLGSLVLFLNRKRRAVS